MSKDVTSITIMTPVFAFLLAAAAASTTMLGALIATSGRPWPAKVFGVTLLLVAGAMVLISALELFPAAVAAGLSVAAVTGLALVGALVVVGMQILARRLRPDGSRLALSASLIAVAIGLHNIPEGAVTAATALLSVEAGLVTATALALHNVPEGIAVAAPVMAAGGGRARAYWFTFIATAGEIAGALMVLAFAEAFTEVRIAGLLAVVGGIMVTLSLLEIAPAGIGLWRQDARVHREA
ncbi:MAG: hypothetical protein R2686_05290 [Candidatus Nanopelagicales bacterium]